MRHRLLPLLLLLLSHHALADVGYTPPSGCITRAGSAHGGQPYRVIVLPKDTVWTGPTLTRAFGSFWSAGVPGPHSTDYTSFMAEAFRKREAPWLAGPTDPTYATNDGKVSTWETLYAYYCGDPRAISGSVTPPPPPPPPFNLCPAGQSCQGPCPTCPICPSTNRFTIEILPGGNIRVTPIL